MKAIFSRVFIKELAKIFHEKSAEDGFHLYELQELYREIFRLRLEKFRKDFKKINNLLKGYVNTHIGEWKITCTKVDMFPKTDPDEVFRRILKASRSSQDVEYLILFDDITEEFKIERNENEGKKISELKILKEIISRNLNIKVESKILNKFVSFFENYFTFHNESRFTYKSFNLIRD